MSAPQHIGDLIFPQLSSLGHQETWTVDPSSLVRVPFTNGTLHFAHDALTAMPQVGQE